MLRECPRCKVAAEERDRGCLFLVCAIGFFPLGLLLFLIPKEQVCPKCGYQV